MPLPQPFTFSQSSLQDYVDCPRRFQLRYIDVVRWPAEETAPALENEQRQRAGERFHRLAQQAILGLPPEKLSPPPTESDLARWWNNFLPHLPRFRQPTSHPEISLSAPLGAHRLLAKYDLIQLSGGKIDIYDWKTSPRRPRPEWMLARLQTRVYRSLLVRAGARLNGGQPIPPESIRMTYWYPDFPDEPITLRYNQADYERDLRDIENLTYHASTAKTFPLTTDNQKCAYCAYRSLCNRGSSAGDWQNAEDTPEPIQIDFEQIGEIEL